MRIVFALLAAVFTVVAFVAVYYATLDATMDAESSWSDTFAVVALFVAAVLGIAALVCAGVAVWPSRKANPEDDRREGLPRPRES